MCTLVATCVILRSLECSLIYWARYDVCAHCSRTTHHSIKIGSSVVFIFVKRELDDMQHANAPERSYSLHFKMIVRFICPARNLSSKSNNFTPNFHHQEGFWHCNFGGHFGIVDVFYFKSHTYTYSVNGQQINKRGFDLQWVYHLCRPSS